MGKALLAAAAIVAFLVHATPSAACTCAIPSAEGALHSSDAVFEGEWLSATGVGNEVVVKLRVLRIFKGLTHNPSNVELRMPGHTLLCAFPKSHFRETPGTPHLVYAKARGPSLIAFACGRYLPSDLAKAEVQALAGGPAAAPSSGAGEPEPDNVPAPAPVSPDPMPAPTPPSAPPSESPPAAPPPQQGCAGCTIGERAPANALAFYWVLAVIAVCRRTSRTLLG